MDVFYSFLWGFGCDQICSQRKFLPRNTHTEIKLDTEFIFVFQGPHETSLGFGLTKEDKRSLEVPVSGN